MHIPLPVSSHFRDRTGHAGFGPVAADRVALIRRRIAARRYPIDSIALATELIACDGDGRTTDGDVGDAVGRLLAVAVDRLEQSAALVLQLEFVERLTADEIGMTIGLSTDRVQIVRNAALLTLKALLDAG